VSNARIDKLFAGPVPELFESCLVPLIFDFYAAGTCMQAVDATIGFDIN
jgi:hypothetical protein